MNLEEKSIYILREARAMYKNLAVLWSTGKDSTTTLWLIKKAFFGSIPFPVIHIDTSYKFKEIYKFRDQLAKVWNLDLRIARNEKAIFQGIGPDIGRLKCCTLLKTKALRDIIEELQLEGIIVSIRRDEHGVRGKERYFSPRDRDFRWRVYKRTGRGEPGLESLQPVELSGWDIYFKDYPDAHHVRIHPLLHWTELEVWEYVRKEGIPVNPLYFARDGYRFRSLGCTPCTEPVKSDARSLDEIIEEVRKDRLGERKGRAQDKEEEYAMESLRAMGYL